jgi:hypothetical protein
MAKPEAGRARDKTTDDRGLVLDVSVIDAGRTNSPVRSIGPTVRCLPACARPRMARRNVRGRSRPRRINQDDPRAEHAARAPGVVEVGAARAETCERSPALHGSA